MVTDKLKQIIFKQLYKELSNVEIIHYKNSIYFIDRENKYWYFEYEKSGNLWWRYNFFTNFFLIFSLESNDYQKVMGDWVEEVLNCRVSTTNRNVCAPTYPVEEVLNCRVSTTNSHFLNLISLVEEVLNCRVSTTKGHLRNRYGKVEEVLNCRVSTTEAGFGYTENWVEEVLKVTN